MIRTKEDRIKLIFNHLGLNQKNFSDKLNVTQQMISDVFTGKKKAGEKIITGVLENISEINPLWFLTGNGPMLTKDVEYKETAIHINPTTMLVPLVNQYAYGSYLNGFSDPEFLEDLPKIPFEDDKEHKGDYICFEVKGDSMDDGTQDSILEGDIILCRNVRQDYWKSKLHINKWDFVIVHKEKGIVVKRIIKHDVEKAIITLHSLNDFYDDYDVSLADVAQIFNIVDFKRRRKRR